MQQDQGITAFPFLFFLQYQILISFINFIYYFFFNHELFLYLRREEILDVSTWYISNYIITNKIFVSQEIVTRENSRKFQKCPEKFQETRITYIVIYTQKNAAGQGIINVSFLFS